MRKKVFLKENAVDLVSKYIPQKRGEEKYSKQHVAAELEPLLPGLDLPVVENENPGEEADTGTRYMSPVTGGGGVARVVVVVQPNDHVHHHKGHQGGQFEQSDEAPVDGPDARVVLPDDEDVFLPVQYQVGQVGGYQGVHSSRGSGYINKI